MNTADCEWLLDEPADYYHEQSRSGRCISSHLLSDFRKSPLLYYKKIKGQIEERPSTAYAIGTAAHKIILEGKFAFDDEYVVTDGPINPHTGAPYGTGTKKYREWAAAQRRTAISTEDYGLIVKMAHSVEANKEAKKLLSNGCAESVVRAKLEGLMCQIRMDWFNPDFGIVDLKTAAELQYFKADCRRFGYVYQLAFYRSVLRQVTGKNYNVAIIGVEKVEPFAAGVWIVTPEVLDLAENSNKAALQKLKECINNNDFPTGYEEPGVIDEL